MTAHCEHGGSVAKRFLHCPGSVLMSRGLPNEETAAAALGTAVHAMNELCLNEGMDAVECIDRAFGGVVITAEMAESGQVYLDECRRFMGAEAGHHVEYRVDLAAINPPVPMFGTVDFAAYLPAIRTLVVRDYKNGFLDVPAEDNDQLRYYALGMLLAMPPGRRVDVVDAGIVQPNVFGRAAVRTTTFDPFDLMEWSVTLVDRVRESLEPGATLNAGDWCRWCPARGLCPERARTAYAVAVQEMPALPEPQVLDPRLLTPQQVADLLRRWPQVKAFGIELERVGERMAAEGCLPGWKLVATRQSASWAEPDGTADVLMIAHELPEAEVYEPRKLVSPAAARGALSAKLLADRLAGYVKGTGVKKPTKKQAEEDARNELRGLVRYASSGVTLAPDGDHRPAITAGGELTALPVELET